MMERTLKHIRFASVILLLVLIACVPAFAYEEPTPNIVTSGGVYTSTNGQWTYIPLPVGGYTATENMRQLEISPRITIKPDYMGKTIRYCPGSKPGSFDWVLNTWWDSQYGLDGYSIVFTTKDMSTQYNYAGIMPQTPGTYYPCIKINSNNVPFSVGVTSVNPRTNVTVQVAHGDNPQWTVEGSSLVLKCPDCGVVLSKVSLEADVRYNLCVKQSVVPPLSIETRDDYPEPNYAIIYEGTGDTDYPASDICPTAVGTYQTKLVLLTDAADITSVLLESEPRAYVIEPHEWHYTTAEYTLQADCAACEEHASVTIDTSTVYEASRTYDGGELDYEVFYEDNWSVQENIEPYTVLFSGYETISKNETAVYTDVYCKPKSTGNYTVRIALLSDPDIPYSDWLSTKEKPYYLADISINSVTETAYGSTEIAQFTQPKLVNGYYQVGTRSELLWCLYNENTTAHIRLTNDIVVNPITVRDDGTVQSASYLIYTWDGFGTESNPYTGMIKGNGYTIYGLYHPSATTHYAGLIDYGQDCRIDDLNVENALIIDTDAGAFIGRYATKSNEYMRGVIDTCRSINCYISGNSTAGGLVGWCSNTGSVGLTFRKCLNNSTVCGPASNGAGGLLGKCQSIAYLDFSLCKNLGNITSGSAGGKAGGIVGCIAISNGKDNFIDISSCLNDGDITATEYLGGIVGYIGSFKDACVMFSNCTSTGYLNRSNHQGGIVGYFENTAIDYYASNYSPYSHVVFNGIYYYDASAPFGKGCKADAIDYTALTKAEYQNGFVCSHYGHTASTHWNMVEQATCTENGVLELKCAVCNKVLESQVIRARGHRFEYGICTFCDMEDPSTTEDDFIGTVLGSPHFVTAVVTASGLTALAVVSFIIIRKKKKREKPAE